MKIVESKGVLNKHLDIVEKALPGKTTMPLLNHIYVESYDGQLIFITNNLEIGIKSVYLTEIEEEGNVLIPSRIIDVVKNLPEGELEIDIDSVNFQIEIKSNNSNFKLTGMVTDEYPAISEASPSGQPMVFKGSLLKRILRKNLFAVSHDESRPAFTGVLFSIRQSKMQLISSDTFRLVLKEIPLEGWDFGDRDFLVPARALRELIKLVDDDAEVSVFPHDNQLAFSFNHVFFSSRLIDDKFPEIKGIIPEDTSTMCKVEKNMLEKSVVRASLVMDSSTQAVELNISNGELNINSSSSLGALEEKIQLIEHEGDNISIVLNARFLMDILKVTEEENVELNFGGNNAPCIIRPENEDDYVYLVLPIKKEN